MREALLDWLPLIPEEIANHWRPHPRLGRFPPFDWAALSARLSENSEFAEMRVAASDPIWRENPQGEFPSSACADLSFNGLAGQVHCLLPIEQLELLVERLIGEHASGDWALRQGFLRFFLLRAIDLARVMQPLDEFSVLLTAIADPAHPPHQPQEPSLCVDLVIHFEAHSLTARLVLSEAFAQSWREHWQGRGPQQIPSSAAQNAQLTVRINAGRVELSPAEFLSLQVGDWICLDASGFSEYPERARATLHVGPMEVGRGTIEGSQLSLDAATPPPIKTYQDQE